MAIKIRKQAASAVATPPSTHLQFFVDSDGVPKLKDSSGNVYTVAQTGNVSLDETTTPAPIANKVLVYAKDVGGISQPFALSDDGTEIQLRASNGTFFDGALQSDVLVESQTGTIQINSGIVLPLTPSRAFTLLMEVEFLSNTFTSGFGRQNFFLELGGAPIVPPASIGGSTVSQEGDANVAPLFATLNDILVNGSGELVLEFALGGGVASIHIKFSVGLSVLNSLLP